MNRTTTASRPQAHLALAGALALCASLAASCGGGGGGGGESISLSGLSVHTGETWQLNRPIDFTFSAPVDFSSVNSNTIAIRQADGTPAVGTYSLIAPNVVRFQPRCPLLPDYSDAGLEATPAQGEPISYTVTIPGGTDVPTVRSLSGGQLSQGQPVQFFTPSVDQALDQLFVDTNSGGPQPLVRGQNAGANAAAACRIEIASDPTHPIYFVSLGGGQIALEGGYVVPLNLYSASSTQVTVVLEFDQAVNPASANVSSQRLKLQFEETPGAGDWQDIASDVTLVGNCTTTGATVRLEPRGILPQERSLRLLIGADFQDVVGTTNPNAQETLPMETRVVDFSAIDPVEPNQGADELYEDFLIGAAVPGSLEDGTASFTEARAEWGSDKLVAGFPFDGTGGPGGNFDLYLPLGQTTFDTNSSTFAGGPDGLITATQTAVNGRLDVRDLVVPEGATLVILGPKPARILATRNVIVNGKILAVGTNNRGVVTLSTANIPEPGASGQAGGGRGGNGSPLTTQHSPRGQRGFGAFDAPGGGGEGGESAYSASANDGQRRPGGGGGGTLGPNVIDPAPLTACPSGAPPRPDNNIIGLDAEQGAAGAANSIGALHPGQRAQGGLPGPRPFYDSDPTNDFYGRMVTPTGQVILGELLQPWAGAGGGGGGDAIIGGTFPAPFGPALAEKGAGGGGGGGSLRILALGDVRLGARGLISVAGGSGNAGESTNGLNRVGGGSGGGSGGHLIIETAGQIDLTEVIGTAPSASGTATDVGLLAPGGQGGAGAGDSGGAGINGQTGPCQDAIAPNSCTVTQGQGAVDGRGGDGGPGLIQLHVTSLSDILSVSGAKTLFNRGHQALTCTVVNPNVIKNNGLIKPPPVGVPAALKSGTTTAGWSQLVPSFGQFSRAQSVWIPLGEAGTRPGAMPAEALEFFFEGTSPADGTVATVSTPSGQKVAELPPVLGTALGSGPLIELSNQSRTTTVSAAGLTDDAYKRNPNLLRAYLLRVFPLGGGAQRDFEIAAATYDLGTNRFTITVQGTGQPLGGLVNADFELRPRFFRISTGGVLDSLPTSARVQIEFQATKETLSGAPDESTGVPSAWTSDVTDLNSDPEWKFVRFRVLFDIQADGLTPLNASTPKPALEFLRMPFRF